MNTNTNTVTAAELMTALRHELLRLAIQQEELAAREAAEVPYWAPRPASVDGHHAAATALRADADRLVGSGQLVTA